MLNPEGIEPREIVTCGAEATQSLNPEGIEPWENVNESYTTHDVDSQPEDEDRGSRATRETKM